MFNFNDIKGKKILVMGLGLHGGGVSVAKWFAERGARVKATDLRQKKELLPSINKLKGFKIEYVLGKHRFIDFKTADLIVQNPGVPRESKYLRYSQRLGKPIENEASIFFALCPAPIMAITGTKGKSSLATLFFRVVKKKYPDTVIAGNIRDVLMLDVLPKIKKSTKIILELSSWHLEGLLHLRKSPQLAFITNIMPDHLNRYHTMANYIKAKQIILRFQNTNDSAVINADNPYTRRLAKTTQANVFWFSTRKKVTDGAYLRQNNVVFCRNKRCINLFSISDIPVIADYQKEQLLAVAIGAKLLGINNLIIHQALKSYKGLHDRLEYLGQKKGIKYYNDTAATMPEAAISALKGLGDAKKKNLVLLAGGANKNLNFQALAKEIIKYAKAVILFKGSATDIMLYLLKGKIDHIVVDGMPEAVRLAQAKGKKGDIILLSPGAASFGVFKHEFDRGEQFKKCFKSTK